MTTVSAKEVKALRDKTNAGFGDCKKALLETNGDQDKAIEWLRTKGIMKAAGKGDRVAAEGMVHSYIHMGGKLGVLVEVNCETDFVARGDDFKNFVHDVAMQIAAANPQYLKREDVPKEATDKEAGIFREQVLNEGKPEKIADKIVEGKLGKWYGEICLMEQGWVKEPKMTIEQLRTEVVQKTGENVQIRRFVRFGLGEGIEKKKDDLAQEVAKMNAEAAAKAEAKAEAKTDGDKGKSYYKVIDGNKYDREMLEIADESVAGQGDGRISKGDAEKLLAAVKDGNNYTDIEKATMAYIRDNYKFTDEADKWFREEIRKWAATK